MLQFWFLWLFIALIVVLVAFTLRKEREDLPRKDILRAVETSRKYGSGRENIPLGILMVRY